MSETFANTRASFNRLRKLLADADDDTRWNFHCWVTGLLLMTIAVIAQFGWIGMLFCFGALLKSVSDKR